MKYNASFHPPPTEVGKSNSYMRNQIRAQPIEKSAAPCIFSTSFCENRYLKAVKQLGWSKTELIANIAANAHENIVLAIEEDVCYIEVQENQKATSQNEVTCVRTCWTLIKRFRSRWRKQKGGWRRWPIMLCRISMGKPTAFMRC